MFGLLDKDIEFIITTITNVVSVKKIGIYGSRATGTYKKTSDIDIVLYGDVDLYSLGEIQYILDEKSPYPYFVDVTIYNLINDDVFKKAIDKEVKFIYELQT